MYRTKALMLRVCPSAPLGPRRLMHSRSRLSLAKCEINHVKLESCAHCPGHFKTSQLAAPQGMELNEARQEVSTLNTSGPRCWTMWVEHLPFTFRLVSFSSGALHQYRATSCWLLLLSLLGSEAKAQNKDFGVHSSHFHWYIRYSHETCRCLW